MLLTLFRDDCEQNKNVAGCPNQDETDICHDQRVVRLNVTKLFILKWAIPCLFS